MAKGRILLEHVGDFCFSKIFGETYHIIIIFSKNIPSELKHKLHLLLHEI